MSSADLSEDENKAVQLEFFSEDFAGREGHFIALYERLHARRTAQALDLPEHSRVLEIGPGSGFLMQWFAHRGHEVVGLDLSPAVARQIDQRWHLRVFVEPLETHVQSGGKGSYDAIIMRHVLEHFRDPLRSLRAASDVLKPGGKIYVAVPNMGSWHRHLRGWSGYEPYHVHYFSQASLALALQRAGFNVSVTATHETLTGWVNTMMRSLGQCGARRNGVATGRGGWKRWSLEFARFVAGLLLFPLRWIQARLGRGEELTAVGVRSAR